MLRYYTFYKKEVMRIAIVDISPTAATKRIFRLSNSFIVQAHMKIYGKSVAITEMVASSAK